MSQRKCIKGIKKTKKRNSELKVETNQQQYEKDINKLTFN